MAGQSAITGFQETTFKTDKVRNGATSIIFIHVEIPTKATKMIYRKEICEEGRRVRHGAFHYKPFCNLFYF